MKKILFTFLLVLAPAPVFAANLTFTADPAVIGIGDTAQVTLELGSDVSLNAISGTIQFSSSLEPLAVTDGSSIISVWVERPSIVNGAVSFAGVVPGGYRGRGGKILHILVRANKAGAAKITAADVQLLKNDGLGTKETATAQSLTLVVGASATGNFKEETDVDPPEPFAAQLGVEDIFGGSKYLAFAAVDKKSGMDHFEISENRLPFMPDSFVATISPYLITDQYLTSDVTIRAIDRAGNVRESIFTRQHYLRPYEWLILAGILIVIGLVRWRRGKRS